MKGRKEKTENKRTYILMLLIVMLMLICIIAICVVGAHSVRPSETAELNKDVEQKEEKISAAVDIAATSIGTNAKATFTASTGEIHIYNNSTSADATISKSSWNTFLKKIITADGNLDAVKTITFDNEVYAPADSSRLFYPTISSTDYPFTNLVTINGNGLNGEKITNASYMFANCSSLKTFFDSFKLGYQKVVNMSYMFYGCSSLESFDVSWQMGYYGGHPSNLGYMFGDCSSLVSLDLSSLYVHDIDTTYAAGMLSGCTKLVNFVPPSGKWGEDCTMYKFFANCESLRKVEITNLDSKYLGNMFWECHALEEVKLAGYTSVVGQRQLAGLFVKCWNLRTVDLSGLGKCSYLNVEYGEVYGEDGVMTSGLFQEMVRYGHQIQDIYYPSLTYSMAGGTYTDIEKVEGTPDSLAVRIYLPAGNWFIRR